MSTSDIPINIVKITSKIDKFFAQNNVDETHGYIHAMKVESHAMHAMAKENLTNHQQKLVCVAALLHDVDDRKYFKSTNYANARNLLANLASDKDIEAIVKMIDLVSASKNKNNIPNDIPPWMLIPRWAVRLESIGVEGIRRCLEYAKRINRPMCTNKTPRAHTEEELWKIATPERYQAYSGKSESMIDHFYDKLLQVGTLVTNNIYLQNEASKRRKTMVNFCLNFWKAIK